jgi:hypothetical protein
MLINAEKNSAVSVTYLRNNSGSLAIFAAIRRAWGGTS